MSQKYPRSRYFYYNTWSVAQYCPGIYLSGPVTAGQRARGSQGIYPRDSSVTTCDDFLVERLGARGGDFAFVHPLIRCQQDIRVLGPRHRRSEPQDRGLSGPALDGRPPAAPAREEAGLKLGRERGREDAQPSARRAPRRPVASKANPRARRSRASAPRRRRPRSLPERRRGAGG